MHGGYVIMVGTSCTSFLFTRYFSPYSTNLIPSLVFVSTLKISPLNTEKPSLVGRPVCQQPSILHLVFTLNCARAGIIQQAPRDALKLQANTKRRVSCDCSKNRRLAQRQNELREIQRTVKTR